jgi:secreted PhoX family phosphatase
MHCFSKELFMRTFQWVAFMVILTIVAVKIIMLEPQKVHLLAASAKHISFDPLPLSQDDTQKRQLRVSKALHLTFEHNRTVSYPLHYRTLAKTGEKIGSGTFGLLTDSRGKGLKDTEGALRISNNPDGSSLITTHGKAWLLTHMEEAPGAVYQTALSVSKGVAVKAEDTRPVDLSRISGSIIDCAASKTDYGTHLGGEEDYAMNSRYADSNSPFYVDCLLDGSGHTSAGVFHYFCAYVEAMGEYLHDENIDKRHGYNGRRFSPYHYGYIIELKPDANGTVESAKHYVTGRYTPELAVMMPDHRTLYMSDDGTFKGFWKFVSDTPLTRFETNWKGSLYAAKLTQVSDRHGGKFTIAWRELGHASDAEIRKMIAGKMQLTDIFDIAKPEGKRCPEGFRRINEDGAAECLRIKPEMHKAAAFLESRKYAAYLGATTEFRKGEGLTYDPKHNRLYFSISAMTKSMRDNYRDEETNNDIRLPKNICGAVYALNLDADFSAVDMEAVVVGEPLSEGDAYAEAYRCHPDKIANPDNIMYLGQNILIIGEDSRNHVNNILWAYDMKRAVLMRLASLPIGAEVTGLDKATVQGENMLLFNIQHPFGDTPFNADKETPDEALVSDATPDEKRASVGYIGGFPPGFFR